MSKIEIIYLTPKEPETVYIRAEEPVVFEVLDEEKIDKYLNLEPKVKVHIEKKEENNKPKKTVEKKTHPKKHKNIKRIFTIFFAIFVVGIIFFNMGYLPIKAFLNAPEPIGCAGEIEVERYIENYPALENIPKLDDIKYKVYVSDASMDTVSNNYKYNLKGEGYNLDYEGTITKKGITFRYLGFIKGITAIGILLTDDINGILGHETAVLSTIGNLYDYKEVIQWYKTTIRN